MEMQEVLNNFWGLLVTVFVTGGVIGYYFNRLIDTGFADNARKHSRKLYVKERVFDIIAQARKKLFIEDPKDVQYIEKVILELRDIDEKSGVLFEKMLRSWQRGCDMKNGKGRWKTVADDVLLERLIEQAKKTLLLSDEVADKLRVWK